VAAMMMSAQARLEHPRHESRPARRANRRARKCVCETNPIRSQPVQVWRAHLREPVAPQLRTHVLPCDPNDIRRTFDLRKQSWSRRQRGTEVSSPHRPT
jgi:hypothetical protein